MIVYKNTKGQFLDDVFSNSIDTIVATAVRKRLGISPAPNEIRSWKNSMTYMHMLLSDPEIPVDSGVAIEYRIPQTSKRIDFLLAGVDDSKREHVVLIELKQWESAELTNKDAIVRTAINRGIHEVSHPSYQVWSYAALIQDYNVSVYEGEIDLHPCAYLHNYVPDGVIDHPFYKEYVDRAPLFLKADAVRLKNFIKRFIKYGDKDDVLFRIDNGRIKPSKSLADALDSMMKGNKEFVLIDDQKVVFEKAVALARSATSTKKKVFIVEGGPGTGKTVVAINLLVKLTGEGLNSQYITKNAAPRAVYEAKLTGTMTRTRISNMFKGSGGFVDALKNVFDALIVDESHRLNEKSGLYGNLGENQIKEIISASRCSIFFIDEDQRVTLQDIGTSDEIRKWAEHHGCEVIEDQLSSQFRCNGSDGYLAWLDDVLGIRDTANKALDAGEYEFNVFDDPMEMYDILELRNGSTNKARMVAGYCWDWVSKKDSKAPDIVIKEFGFSKKWNLQSYGSLWAIDPASFPEVGCIHTCQGLELEYIGVIIGPDLRFEHGKVVTDVTKRSKGDRSVRGYKKLLEKDPKKYQKEFDMIIRNTYRTLMTRGLKGCYVYCTDKNLQNYFKTRLALKAYEQGDDLLSLAAE